MKKLLTILSLLSIFTTTLSCKKNDNQKAHVTIEQFLKKKLNDFDSYENVEFYSLDSLTSREINFPNLNDSILKLEVKKGFYTITEEKIIELSDKLNSKLTSSEKESLKSDLDFEQYYLTVIEEECKKLKDYIDLAQNNNNSKLIGWKLKHTFRAKNGFGAKVLRTYEWELNKSLDSIINYKEL